MACELLSLFVAICHERSSQKKRPSPVTVPTATGELIKKVKNELWQIATERSFEHGKQIILSTSS